MSALNMELNLMRRGNLTVPTYSALIGPSLSCQHVCSFGDYHKLLQIFPFLHGLLIHLVLQLLDDLRASLAELVEFAQSCRLFFQL